MRRRAVGRDPVEEMSELRKDLEEAENLLWAAWAKSLRNAVERLVGG